MSLKSLRTWLFARPGDKATVHTVTVPWMCKEASSHRPRLRRTEVLLRPRVLAALGARRRSDQPLLQTHLLLDGPQFCKRNPSIFRISFFCCLTLLFYSASALWLKGRSLFSCSRESHWIWTWTRCPFSFPAPHSLPQLLISSPNRTSLFATFLIKIPSYHSSLGMKLCRKIRKFRHAEEK